MTGRSDAEVLAPDLCGRSGLGSAAAAIGDAGGRPATIERRLADAVRALSIDAVAQAGSGHAGMPLGMADVATALWTRLLRFDATDPAWPDRDRFVLSAGHGSMLLYALLHLTGHAGMEIGALQRFRQLDSAAAGHPEHGEHPAIETTTGPLGQGLATAVGMALAERMLAARFGRSLVDHRTWVVASDGDLMKGVAHEAAGLAGHLRLEKLTVLWDDSEPGIEGEGVPDTADEPLKRFAAAGWATRRVDGHDPEAIAAALAFAVRSRKPTLIACRTVMGSAAGGSDVPPGATRISAARAALDWPHPPFTVPLDLLERWAAAGIRGTNPRRAWLKRLTTHPLRAEFERVTGGRLPELWHEAAAAVKTELAEARPHQSTRHSSQAVLHALVQAVPELTGGATDAPGAAPGRPDGMAAVTPGSYAGRYVPFGIRDHGMAAAMNGMALHGGLLPTCITPLASSDCMRPAIRLSAMMRQRVVYQLTHDSIGLGQDGPTVQPVEHLASFRAMPGVTVLRPADPIETAECWELAIRRADGPSLLVLSSQEVPPLRTDMAENRCARGGYVLAEADGAREATLIASGSEVAIAMEAQALLAGCGIRAAVVSLPCWELFATQDEALRNAVLGSGLRVGIEAACGFGWDRWLGPDGIFIGMTGFGASAPGPELFTHFGITPDAVAAAVRKRLHPPPPPQEE